MKTSSANALTAEPTTGLESADDQPTARSILSHESISTLAYQLWEARGGPEGSPEQDWFQAQEVLAAGTDD